MLVQGLYFILGLVALYYGADFSLESAEKIGKSWKMSPLLVGLFIVGFGTSLPEFFVSQLACFRGRFEMSLGNVLGSNIANIFLVLGVCGLYTKLPTDGKDLLPQFLFHLIATLFCGLFVYFGEINFVSLSIFSIIFLSYFWVNFKSDKDSENKEFHDEIRLSWRDYFFLIFGFALLYAGGEVLVFSGSHLGVFFGVSEFAISAILVAFGTSFPELVTSIIACKRKKDTDLIIGNIIGSNIFNICFVLGSVGIYQFKIVGSFFYESIILAVIALIFIGLSLSRIPIGKVVSFIFLIVYFGITAYWVSYS